MPFQKRSQGNRTNETEEISRISSTLAQPAGLDFKKFSELPISSKTLSALEKGHFVNLTEIQSKSICLALRGRDVLASAKTGSGKTLAFLVPVLERLFLQKWTKKDGLGALIISPTRELALQIFEVLRNIGFRHDFSAGLVIGGKNLKQEQAAIGSMNILVATPGRLLQHLDQSSSLDCTNLQVLVLDEADRILDMGFAKTMNAILSALPKDRQTMLFSATQSEDVENLASLTLRNPVHVSTYKDNESKTPDTLKQQYFICKPERKIEHLYAFMKACLKTKIIVFVSSCKQVRFLFEAFCKMQPGTPLLALHGKQKQHQRMSIYNDFCKKQNAVLICTDIAARGLDFPAVDWVFQLDCPESWEAYVHRVGRTARYNSSGFSLLFLLPNEVGILSELGVRNITVNEIRRDSALIRKNWNVTSSLTNLVSQFPDLKHLAQKAAVSYIRSLYILRNKFNFSISDFPIKDFAQSLGLSHAPRIMLSGSSAVKNISREGLLNDDGASHSEDDFLKISRQDHDVAGEISPMLIAFKSKSRKRPKTFGSQTPSKVVYTDSSDLDTLEMQKPKLDFESVNDFIFKESGKMATIDAQDKLNLKERQRKQKQLKKRKQQETNGNLE